MDSGEFLSGRLRTQDHRCFVDTEEEGKHLSWIRLMRSRWFATGMWSRAADSVADGMQVETSQQSRATIVASDSILAFAGREFFPDLRQGVQEVAQFEIVRQPLHWRGVVDVFPKTDDAEVPQPSAPPRCRRLVLVHPPGGTPVSIQDRDSDSTDSLAGVERVMGGRS